MILSASATHALRAMAILAETEGKGAVQGRAVARRMRVPSHYLAKVLATLARTGVLEATRGARGGYRLSRPASRIRLLQVVLPFEGKRAAPGCLLRPGRPCRESARCSAHERWSEVKASYTRFLESTTVADIRGGAPR